MSFSTLLFTEKGRALQSKSVAGAALKFTKISMGSGELGSQSQITLTAIIKPEVTLNITEIRRNTDYVTVKSRFTNSAINVGFYWREIGIYAEDPDIGEILYSYANAGALAEYIPPQASEIIEKVICLSIIVGDAVNVTATINESLAFATVHDFEKHLSDKSNPHSVSKEQVGLGNVPNVATNDQAPTYAEATSNKSLISGEKLSTAFGKIAKAINSLISHLSDTNNPHNTTASQVGLGNVPNVTTNDQTPTYTESTTLIGLSTGEKISVAFGKIAKAISSLMSHLTNTLNPHGVTKSQIGLGNVDNTSDLNKPISTAAQAALNSKADLGGDGKILSSQLPSYVDDVLEGTWSSATVFKNPSGIAYAGEAGKIYVDTTSGKTYRWSGSSYVEISASLALGETASTAYRGDRGKTAYDHSQVTSGNPHGTTRADIGLGNVDNTADADKNVLTATRHATARTIAMSGDVIGAATSFDGSKNITIPMTLPSSGVAAGTYRNVTVNTKGLVTAGSNPTTLAGYSITDAVKIINFDATATDLNNITSAGFYIGCQLTNSPGGTNTWWYVLVEQHSDSSWCKQTATAYGGGASGNYGAGDTYIRIKTGNTNTWTAWKKVYNEFNFNPRGIDSSNLNISNNVSDCNNAIVTGFFYVNGGAVNAPSGNSDGNLIVMANDSAKWVQQLYFAWSGGVAIGKTFRRQLVNGTWNNWYQIWDGANDGSGSGLDADTLDGFHANNFMRSYQTTTSDLNTFTTSGTYFINNSTMTNGPTGAWPNGQIIVFHGDGDTLLQMYADFHDSNVYIRTASGIGGTPNWRGWKMLWNNLNDGSGSGLDADTVDGLHSYNFLRDRRRELLAEPLNDPNYPEPYVCSTSFGKSIGLPTEWFHIMGFRHQDNNGFGAQLAIGLNEDGLLYYRRSNATTWTGWKKIWNSSNMGHTSGLDADTVDGYHATDLVRTYPIIFGDSDNGTAKWAKLCRVETSGTYTGLHLKILIQSRFNSATISFRGTTGITYDVVGSLVCDFQSNSFGDIDPGHVRIGQKVDTTNGKTYWDIWVYTNSWSNVAYQELERYFFGGGAVTYFTGVYLASQPEIANGYDGVFNPTSDIWAKGSMTIGARATGTIGNRSAAIGNNNIASGLESQAFGNSNTASGLQSFAEGYNNVAVGNYSHAEGTNNTVYGTQAHVEGNGNSVSVSYGHAEGFENRVLSNSSSHAEGMSNVVTGMAAHVEGAYNTATGGQAHAEGNGNIASGDYSHAEGIYNIASTAYSHIEGLFNLGCSGALYKITAFDNTNKKITLDTVFGLSVGDYLYIKVFDNKAIDSTAITAISGNIVTLNTSATITANWKLAVKAFASVSQYFTHVEGKNNTSSGNESHAEGFNNIACGGQAHAEGASNISFGAQAHAEGYTNTASGNQSHVEGYNSTASGTGSHAEGYNSTASGNYSHAEGNSTTVLDYSHAEGQATRASGSQSHAEGGWTKASGTSSHAEGDSSEASGVTSHAEGDSSEASGATSHAEGDSTKAAGDYSHAEGYHTIAGVFNTTNTCAHAEGHTTQALGWASHAEGYTSIASGNQSHAEAESLASGIYSHAEGKGTVASGRSSHTEGETCTASGDYSHAEGLGNVASGVRSHASGLGNSATGSNQTVIGQYNSPNASDLFQVGCGTSDSDRANALTVTRDGDLWIRRNIIASNLNTINAVSSQYGNAGGGYIKMGRVVTVNISMAITTKPNGLYPMISGLPAPRNGEDMPLNVYTLDNSNGNRVARFSRVTSTGSILIADDTTFSTSFSIYIAGSYISN